VVLAVLKNLIGAGATHFVNNGDEDQAPKHASDTHANLLQYAGRDVGQRDGLVRLADICRKDRGDERILDGAGVHRSVPSSMFLMRTERSATSLSTVNCSLSEVTRRTMMDRVYISKGGWKGEDWIRFLVVVEKDRRGQWRVGESRGAGTPFCTVRAVDAGLRDLCNYKLLSVTPHSLSHCPVTLE
jgi:hypothetical protein